MNLIYFVSLDSDVTKDAAIDDLQKQINNIVTELTIVKEHQALQTGKTKKRCDLVYILPYRRWVMCCKEAKFGLKL